MSEDEKNRLVAWTRELAAAHERLRQASRFTQDAVTAAHPVSVTDDLLLYCHGFCAALRGHHESEDVALFPELAARHPELRRTLAKLHQDHEMIASLLGQFDQALRSTATNARLSRHLDGLAAIMESHFRYEQRELRDALSTLELDVDLHTFLGPL